MKENKTLRINKKEARMIWDATYKVAKSLRKSNGFKISSLDVMYTFMLVQNMGYGFPIERKKIDNFFDSVCEPEEIA